MKAHYGALMLAAAIGASALAAGQSDTIRSHYNLSVASSANMERIPPKQGLSALDKKFLIEMSKVNLAEIEMGNVAEQNGSTWGQSFGKDMIREHKLAQDQLAAVAATVGIGLPKTLDAKDEKTVQHMAHLHGSSFDGAYRMMMIAGHKQVLGLIDQEIAQGHNSDARNYAVYTETEVKLHLKLAQQGTTATAGNG